MKYIVDRFEENFVVLEKEKGGTIDIRRDLLPDVKEGDVVIKEGDVYRPDEKATMERKALIEEKIKRLFGKK